MRFCAWKEASTKLCALDSITNENSRPEVGRDILQRLEQVPEREPEAAKGDEDDGREGASGEEESQPPSNGMR